MKIRSSPASSRRSSTTALGQHHSVGLKTPGAPRRSSPWPTTAWEGEKDSSAHDAAAPCSIPFQHMTLLPEGWARPSPTCSWGKVRNRWLLEVETALCLNVTTRGCWEKDRVSGSYCNTLPVGEGPRLISLPLASPCSSLQETSLQPLPSSRTPRLHPHHDGDTLLFSKHLCPQTVPLGPRDTSPVPRQGLSEQTGITWADTWSV